MPSNEEARWAAQLAHDSAVMHEFKVSEAWAVLRRHMEYAHTSSLSVVLSTMDMNHLLTQRGAAVAVERLMNLPDNIIEEARRTTSAS